MPSGPWGSLPGEVRAAVEDVLGFPVVRATPVGGGCIHGALRLEGGHRAAAFLKTSPRAAPGLFETEAGGLAALHHAGGRLLRVPEVLGWGGPSDGAGPGWLLLEWISPGPPPIDAGERLAAGLTALHRPLRGDWGWSADNWIGSLPQRNAPSPTWGGFWRDRRLEPLFRECRDRGFLRRVGDARNIERLLAGVEALAAPGEADGPSLLHGDLWSGNVFFAATGEPVVVDPAVYRGHREVDLAMLQLFGGGPRGTLEAYATAQPPAPGAAVRRALYQLYPLLVHVLLFGSGYEDGVRERMGRVLV